MAYVYIYYDPRKTPIEPIYIGKGIDDRMYHHINKKCHNPILERKLTKIKELGLEPIIEKIQDELSDEDALKIEVELIAKYGRIDLKTGTLCNLTEGGEGSSGRIVSDETKQLWSEQRKGKKQTEAQYEANCNRTISEETKEKQRKANKGHSRHTPEQLKILKEFNTGRKASQETIDKMSKQRKGKQTQSNNPAAIKVNIFNSTGDLIYSCHGNFEVVCKENGLPSSALSNSYLNEGKPIYTSKMTPKKTISLYEKFIGWYAIKQ